MPKVSLSVSSTQKVISLFGKGFETNVRVFLPCGRLAFYPQAGHIYQFFYWLCCMPEWLTKAKNIPLITVSWHGYSSHNSSTTLSTSIGDVLVFTCHHTMPEAHWSKLLSQALCLHPLIWLTRGSPLIVQVRKGVSAIQSLESSSLLVVVVVVVVLAQDH